MPAVSVYKPVAHGGGPLVVLMTRDTPDYAQIALTDASGRVIDVGRYSGRTNGGRPTYRFSKHGARYQGPVSVSAGGQMFPIGNPGVRRENVGPGRLEAQSGQPAQSRGEQLANSVGGSGQQPTGPRVSYEELGRLASKTPKLAAAIPGSIRQGIGSLIGGTAGANIAFGTTTNAIPGAVGSFKAAPAFAGSGSKLGAVLGNPALIAAGAALAYGAYRGKRKQQKQAIRKGNSFEDEMAARERAAGTPNSRNLVNYYIPSYEAPIAALGGRSVRDMARAGAGYDQVLNTLQASGMGQHERWTPQAGQTQPQVPRKTLNSTPISAAPRVAPQAEWAKTPQGIKAGGSDAGYARYKANMAGIQNPVRKPLGQNVLQNRAGWQ